MNPQAALCTTATSEAPCGAFPARLMDGTPTPQRYRTERTATARSREEDYSMTGKSGPTQPRMQVTNRHVARRRLLLADLRNGPAN